MASASAPPSIRLASRPTVVKHRRALRRLREEEFKDLAQLVTAIESDYQFRLGYLVLTSLIQATPVVVTVSPSKGLSERDLERATRLAENLTTRWREMLPHALRAIGYGRAAFERTYRHDLSHDLYLVDGLDYLPFEHTQLTLDRSGSFAGIELQVEDEKILLEPSRSWWFALDPTSLRPHGRSRYLGAPYEVYQKRRQLEEQESIWFSKFALGHGVARAPERSEVDADYDASDPGALGASGEIIDPMEVMRDQCAQIESGGVLVLSSQTYPDGKYLYDYEPTPGPAASGPLEERRRMLDAAALRSLGVPDRALTQDGESGSYALAEVHRRVLEQTCESILGPLATDFEKHVLQKAIDVNAWGPHRPELRMLRQPVGDGHRQLARELARSLMTAPPAVQQNAGTFVDLTKLLELADLPVAANPE